MKKGWIIVWSIINFAFSGFLAQPLTNFVKGMFKESDAAELGWLTGNRYSLLSFIAFAAIFLIFLGLTALVLYLLPSNREKRRKNNLEKELEEYNCKVYTDKKIKATWKVIPNGLMDDIPFITELQLFCMHESHKPTKMKGGVCPYNGCPNHIRGVSEYNVKDDIESDLAIMKQKLENKYK